MSLVSERVRPSCAAVGNAANLSLQLTGGAGTVTSVNVAIHHIACLIVKPLIKF